MSSVRWISEVNNRDITSSYRIETIVAFQYQGPAVNVEYRRMGWRRKPSLCRPEEVWEIALPMVAMSPGRL